MTSSISSGLSSRHATGDFEHSTYDRHSHAKPNVGGTERAVCMALGSGLVYFGIRRGTVGGLLAAAAGVVLARRGYKGHCEGYEALGVSTAEAGGRHHGSGNAFEVRESITIDAPPQKVYDFWRRLENLPRFMDHLKSVEEVDRRRSRWVARGPAGSSPSWEAEIIDDRTGELISWRSLEGSAVDNRGTVRFRDRSGGTGTEVAVELEYRPPAGALGKAVAVLSGENPSRQIREDLQSLRTILEGESVGGRRPFSEPEPFAGPGAGSRLET